MDAQSLDAIRQIPDVNEALQALVDFLSRAPENYGLEYQAYGCYIDLRRRQLEASGEHTKDTHGATSQDSDTVYPNRLIEQLSKLGTKLLRQYIASSHLPDLNNVISCLGDAAAMDYEYKLGDPAMYANLATALKIRFDLSSYRSDLDDAIKFQERATQAAPDTDPRKAKYLGDLGNFHARQFQLSGQITQLAHAISYLQAAISLTHDGNLYKRIFLNDLAQISLLRFIHQGERSDVDQAISSRQQAVQLMSNDEAEKPCVMKELATSFLNRFQRFGDQKDIEEAISICQRAQSLNVQSQSTRAEIFGVLGSAFSNRFGRSGNIADADRSIDAHEHAISLTPDDNSEKPRLLTNLATTLMQRSSHGGEKGDVGKAISMHEEAIRLTPIGDSSKALRSHNLGLARLHLFHRLGNLSDLSEAISSLEEAILLTPDGHQNKANWFGSLGGALRNRYTRMGQLEDLDTAVSYLEKAVSLTPDDHLDKAKWLNSLGNTLEQRFERLGNIADIDKAILSCERAVDLASKSDDNPSRHGSLLTLGTSHLVRFQKLNRPGDLDAAISALETAIPLTPETHPNRAEQISRLGNCLGTRYTREKNEADITMAASLHEQTIALTPLDHPRLSVRLKDLAWVLMARFEDFKEEADINKAIENMRQAVDLTPGDHPYSALFSHILARALSLRHNLFRRVSDRAPMVEALRQAALSLTGGPTIRFMAARSLAAAYAQWGNPESIEMFTLAMGLIDPVVWIGQTVGKRYESFSTIGNIATDAAAAAINFRRYDLAIEWLEQGRSIVWSQILQLRTPMEELRVVDRSLVDRLQEVAQALDHASIERQGELSPVVLSSKADSPTHRRLAEQWDALLEQARQIPGFGDFLRPRKIDALRDVTHSGDVVVINVHMTRCDALILRPQAESVVHVPLPLLSFDKVSKMKAWWDRVLPNKNVIKRGSIKSQPIDPSTAADEFFAQLWDAIAQPILSALGYLEPVSGGELPHITWCMTGPLSFVPLHAAGIYDKKKSQLKIFDYVVSSYSPTLAALLVRPQHDSGFRGILGVSQAATPGQAPLATATSELDQIQRHAAGLRFTRLEGARATTSALLDYMADHSWAHLACHAFQNPGDPTASAFHLHDGPLDLSAISRASLKHARLAFLSACETATGDERLSEESVHLAAGMLVIGYPTVIATMWPIQDAHAPLVAESFYKEMLKGGSTDARRAARALHHAVGSLREHIGEDKIGSWAPYIHLGL